MPDTTVRPLDPSRQDEIELVASRMKLTLVEVLDRARADELFDDRQLVDRVHWHLHEPRAEVLLVEVGGEIAGHSIVRVEQEHDREIGLFSTTYVHPPFRRAGLASLLLADGERWMRRAGMTEAASYTDANNRKLIELYRRHGYSVVIIDPEWARVHRRLD